MKFKRGDIIKLNFNPTKGHEQGNFRPALVMNFFPLPGDLNIVLPITSKEKNYPFESPYDRREQKRSLFFRKGSRRYCRAMRRIFIAAYKCKRLTICHSRADLSKA